MAPSSCQASLSGSNGIATGSCQITEQAPGTYSFTASYPGDASFDSSQTSSPATVTVGQAPSSTSITSTTSNPVVGQPVTAAVRVKGEFTGSGDPVPTGTVTVSDGTRSCQASLSGSNGIATGSCQITEQAPGTYSFAASYPGDPRFDSSHGSAARVAVAKAKSRTSLKLSTASVVYGNEKTLKLTATAAPQFTGTPGGVVTITAGQATMCTVQALRRDRQLLRRLGDGAEHRPGHAHRLLHWQRRFPPVLSRRGPPGEGGPITDEPDPVASLGRLWP